MDRRCLWILNHYAAPPDRPAGTRHYDLARQLVARGYDVTIFAAGFSHFTLKEERLNGWRLFRTEHFDAVRFVWIRTLPYRGNSAFRLANMLSYAVAVLIVQARFRRPRWVIGSSVHPFAALAGYLVARVRRATFLYEIRDLWPQTLIDMGALAERSLPARAMRFVERFLAERAAGVITLLGDLHAYLDERGIRVHRVRYIPNGVVLAEAESTVSIPISPVREWLVEDRLICAYLGVHGAANGLDVFLEAADLIRKRGADRVRILLVGDGPEKDRLRRLADRMQLKNLAFLPPIPKREVASFLTRVHVGLFHLGDTDVFRYGISSNKLFDYLASATPVVFACRSGYDPVTAAAAGVSIPPEDAPALADAIIELSLAPQSRLQAMGQRGRTYVQEHHSIEKLGARLDSLLLEIVKR